MKFTVIIPTYNRMLYTKIAIESVLHQDFGDYELIVIDDGSTDHTVDMLEDYQAKHSQFRYIVHVCNLGVSAARNSGIKAALGEWICLLDSDDRFRKDKLSQFAYSTDTNPEFKLFHSNEIWYRNQQLIQEKKKHAKPDGDAFERSLELCCISPSSVCIHKSLFEENGLFDERLPACEDYDMWLRLVHKYPIKLIHNRLTIKEGGHDDQLSSQHSLDKYRIMALNKLIKSDVLDVKQLNLSKEALNKKLDIYAQGCQKNNKVKEYNSLLNSLLL